MFSDNFVKLCAERGVHPTTVSEQLGYSRTMGAKWAKGSIPRKTTLHRIGDYFGVSVEYLLGDDTKKAPTEDGEREDVITQHMQSSTKMAILIEMFNQLPEADQNDIICQLLIRVRDQAAQDAQK